mmetsp:Transcript_8999/g.10818  ORF Transcript_8999/g.10818 Transcript_8999/m.10818 type:complete len:95 (+) Transcript_8999:11090-11374(+)
MKRYLIDKAKQLRISDNLLDIESWRSDHYRPSQVPKQTNGSDCGVFICAYAHLLGIGQPLNFSQADIHHFRQRMAIDLFNLHECKAINRNQPSS